MRVSSVLFQPNFSFLSWVNQQESTNIDSTKEEEEENVAI